jgi:polysaccharide export outer membrane protein
MEGQMSASQINRVLSHLRYIHLKQEFGCSNDGDLLERFLARQEEIAFEALVRRYGPMVLGVCRRVLVDHHDAEDAFQATFLVLVRKASSIRPRSHVGPWLYGVACRTALQSRSAIARRRRAELDAGRIRPNTISACKIESDLRLLFDEELCQLPEKYRVPLVLCLLHGDSRKVAAQLLGWSEGTLSGRLARAKQMIGQRLRRRGVALGAGALMAALSEGAATAKVPVSLVIATVKCAVLFARPGSLTIISAPVLALTKEVLKIMMMSKLKFTVGVMVILMGIGFGSGSASWLKGTTVQGAPSPEAEALMQGSARVENKKALKPGDYVIEPPDLLVVEYAGPEATDPVKITGSRLVRPDGTVGLGQLGSVMVSGQTTSEARGAIAKHLASRLEGFDAKNLSVSVVAYNSKVFYVLVEDTDGGSRIFRFSTTGNETVLDALALSKVSLIGIGKKRIIVNRPSEEGKGSQVLPVDWKAITQESDTATNYLLQAGDRLCVKQAAGKKNDGASRIDGLSGHLVVVPGVTDYSQWSRPSADEIVRALPESWAKVELKFTFELISYDVDEEQSFPLVGRARLAHAHWKCTVFSDLGVEVIYLDRSHLMPIR